MVTCHDTSVPLCAHFSLSVDVDGFIGQLRRFGASLKAFLD